MSKTTIAISRNIVDDLILGTLFDVDDNDEENQAQSSTRSLYTPVTEISKEGEALPIVAKYAVFIKNTSQPTYVQSLGVRSILLSMCRSCNNVREQ